MLRVYSLCGLFQFRVSSYICTTYCNKKSAVSKWPPSQDYTMQSAGDTHPYVKWDSNTRYSVDASNLFARYRSVHSNLNTNELLESNLLKVSSLVARLTAIK
jgi:hypothetical protein